jgi:ubiquitin thioesterase protein OTUB1
MDAQDTVAMIGDLEPPSVLRHEYENADSPGFIPGIDFLSAQYRHMRRIRGDGNCFYRAFIFSYLENLLNDYQCVGEKRVAAVEEKKRIIEIITNSKSELVEKHSYSEIAIESFQEVRLCDILYQAHNPVLLSTMSIFSRY